MSRWEGGSGSVKLGRLLHKSMFPASSGSRAVPDTFQGASVGFDLLDRVSVYGAVFDKWSPRGGFHLEQRRTDPCITPTHSARAPPAAALRYGV